MLNPKRILAAALLICLCTAAAPVYADKIYAAFISDKGVAVVDPVTLDAWGEIKTGPSPAEMARIGKYVFVTESKDSVVSVIDAEKDAYLKDVRVGEWPLSTAASPDGGFVLVGNYLAGEVCRIGVDGEWEPKCLKTPGRVYSLTISPDGNKAYAGGKEGKLWAIDLDQFKVVDEAPIPPEVYEIVITPRGDRLILNSLQDEEVTIYALPGMQVLKKLKAGSHGLAISPDGGELWFGGREGAIEVYSFAQDKVIAELNRDCNTNLNMIFSPDGKRLFASPAGRETQDIYVYDTATKKKAGAVHLRETPRGLLYIEENVE